MGSLDLAILKLDNPKFYVYRWDDGELRWFITTRGGYLIEPEYNYLWDDFFPFLHKSANGLLHFPNCIEKNEINSTGLLWNPITINYSHFLLDILAGFIFFKNNLKHCIKSDLKLPISSQTRFGNWN